MIANIDNSKGDRDRNCRVWLNGEEVTRWCVYADDGVGLVRLWKHDENDRLFSPKILETHHGRVRITCPHK